MLKYASKSRYDFVVDKCGRLPVVTALRCVRLHRLISCAKKIGGTRQSNATISHRPWFIRYSVTLMYIISLNTDINLIYLNTLSVPRSKHTPSQ